MSTDGTITPAHRAPSWRRYRFTAQLAAVISMGLAMLVMVLANSAAQRIAWRRNFSRSGAYRLSRPTQSLLDGLSRDVLITVMVRPTHELANPVRDLLREYDFHSPRVHVTVLDPSRDLIRVQALAEQHGLRESNIVLFECGDRQRVVNIEAIAEFDYLPILSGGSRRVKAFHGESAFSSALRTVSDMTAPIVYYLRGYGERDPNDPHPVSGYTAMARLLRDEQMDWRELRLSEAGGIPADADLLMLVGPRRRLAAAELALLEHYLVNQGRLLLLLDKAETGPESLLPKWGVTVSRETVGGLTLSGAELFVGAYGDHPITETLKGITTVFYRPRRLIPDDRAVTVNGQADQPRVSVLAAGREILDADGRRQPQLPASAPPVVAVAIEKGLVRGIDVRLRPTRLVVVGDADFISNSGMVAGNANFLINALNWLLERDSHLEIAPQHPTGDILLLHRQSLNLLFICVVAAIPGLWIVLGLAMRWSRRNPA